jgi:hypothetical protein
MDWTVSIQLSSAAVATTATLSSEGLEHELALHADLKSKGWQKE